MSFIEKVKNIVANMRAAGKTEKEVKKIIERASEAATITKKPEIIKKPETKVVSSTEKLQNELRRNGISANEAVHAIEVMYKVEKVEKTNNWRKYHGIPLKRRKGGRKSGNRKGNDSKSKNADVS